jgi:zinc-ribbon domain
MRRFTSPGNSYTVSLNMNCPNCGLSNPDNARFCANCGTSLGEAPQPWQTSYQPQPPSGSPGIVREKNSVMRNVVLGCLVVLVIFFFVSLSCTRACFRSRRYYRHYGMVIRPSVMSRLEFDGRLAKRDQEVARGRGCPPHTETTCC